VTDAGPPPGLSAGAGLGEAEEGENKLSREVARADIREVDSSFAAAFMVVLAPPLDARGPSVARKPDRSLLLPLLSFRTIPDTEEEDAEPGVAAGTPPPEPRLSLSLLADLSETSLGGSPEMEKMGPPPATGDSSNSMGPERGKGVWSRHGQHDRSSDPESHVHLLLPPYSIASFTLFWLGYLHASATATRKN